MIFLGLDIGSSFIKASLFDADNNKNIVTISHPITEMEIISSNPGFAEQDPNLWFKHVKEAILLLHRNYKKILNEVQGIGIAYQMHGLVCVDDRGELVRNAIIWCDSRAVEIGDRAFNDLGEDFCLNNLNNSPGNFTASRLYWVQKNEPGNYERIAKIMLPGDYIAYRLTGELNTTIPGLSEGIFWDLKNDKISKVLLDYFGINPDLLLPIVPTFANQGGLNKAIAAELGLKPGIPVSYRAGDQPNNAFSLNVLKPGEIAATAGTSGVIFSVTDRCRPDAFSRLNTFVHVNHDSKQPRYGNLLCVNGAGIMNAWLKQNIVQKGKSYEEMNDLASQVEPGSNGLRIFPFGNGAERMLMNKNIGASIKNLDLNIHNQTHIIRAAHEGIAFGMIYGLNIMKLLNFPVQTIRAGLSNLFLSPLFRETFCDLSEVELELYDVDGSQGAAKGAALGAGYYKDPEETFISFNYREKLIPKFRPRLKDAYAEWEFLLNKMLK